MSSTHERRCDGCGEVIDENVPRLEICLWNVLQMTDYQGSPYYPQQHDLHGIQCLPAWLEKMPASVRRQLTGPINRHPYRAQKVVPL